jgi:hypothetical protein
VKVCSGLTSYHPYAPSFARLRFRIPDLCVQSLDSAKTEVNPNNV